MKNLGNIMTDLKLILPTIAAKVLIIAWGQRGVTDFSLLKFFAFKKRETGPSLFDSSSTSAVNSTLVNIRLKIS